MTFNGQVRDGTIVLDESVLLPDGALVRVEVLDTPNSPPLHPDVLRITGILPGDVDMEKALLEAIIEKHK